MTFAVLAEPVGSPGDPVVDHTGWREFDLTVPAHGGWLLDCRPGSRLASLSEFGVALAACERLLETAAAEGIGLRCAIATGTLSGGSPGSRPDFTTRTRRTVEALCAPIEAGRIAISVKLHAALHLSDPAAADRFEAVRFSAGGPIASAFLLRQAPITAPPAAGAWAASHGALSGGASGPVPGSVLGPAPAMSPADLGYALPFVEDENADDPVDNRLVDRAERILAEAVGSFASWIVEEAAGDASSNEEFIDLVVRASPPSIRARMRASLTTAVGRHRTARA